MPRNATLLEDNQHYHILIGGNRQLFRDPADYGQYLTVFHTTHRFHGSGFSLLHYCLLPDQIHLLIHLNRKASFPRFIQIQNQRYFYHYRRRYGFRGHLFNGRYRALPLTGEAQLLECARYIERQPVRCGLADSPFEYEWSSCAYYGDGSPNLGVQTSPAFMQLAECAEERRERYRRYLNQVRPYDLLIERLWMPAKDCRPAVDHRKAAVK